MARSVVISYNIILTYRLLIGSPPQLCTSHCLSMTKAALVQRTLSKMIEANMNSMLDKIAKLSSYHCLVLTSSAVDGADVPNDDTSAQPSTHGMKEG